MDKNSKILIVGAGIFGLSTALHLAKCGYTDVHLFDSQAYDKNGYERSEGATAASVDENRVIRASYGGSKLYQDLAFEAMLLWREWSERSAGDEDGEGNGGARGRGEEVKLFDQCGLLRLSENGLETAEVRTQANFPDELKGRQYRVSDSQRREDALRDGIPESKIDPFGRLEKGYALASKACAFALRLCRRAGVRTHLGPDFGMKELVRRGNRVTGIITQDGNSHSGDLVIVACGGWTPSLLPETEHVVETTAGSVLFFRLPSEREDIWTKYAPQNFPVWCWNMTSYDHDSNPLGGIFGFPRTPDGVFKIIFTGAQWTSYTHQSASTGRPISHPMTGGEQIPEEAMNALRIFCAENLPELLELDPEDVKLCWYSDTVDSSFLIDYVPETGGLMVCSGGSGHGFKFLPLLGRHVVDVVERRDTEYTRLFAWRAAPKGERNGLEEVPEGWRTLERQRMVGKEAWRR